MSSERPHGLRRVLAVHWSPRSQGFPREADADHTEAPLRPAVASGV
jgi:hypothetical protein